MADPLRRTLLAKLRGKKSKKGATVGGGYGSAAAASAANGGREAFIETLQIPCANGREVGRACESPSWRPPLTTITVSKKRNWLQQSSLGRNHCAKDEQQGMLGAEEEGVQGSYQPPPPPSPSPDHLRPSGGNTARPVRLHLPQVNVSQAKASPHSRSVDPAEENDADDEGEIWYNPIPEDEEQDTSHRSTVQLLVPPRVDPQRRPSRGADVGHGGRSLGVGAGGGGGLEALGESLCGGGGGGGSQEEGFMRRIERWKPTLKTEKRSIERTRRWDVRVKNSATDL